MGALYIYGYSILHNPPPKGHIIPHRVRRAELLHRGDGIPERNCSVRNESSARRRILASSSAARSASIRLLLSSSNLLSAIFNACFDRDASVSALVNWLDRRSVRCSWSVDCLFKASISRRSWSITLSGDGGL